MPKNWLLLISISCGVGFGSTLLISRNLQQSSWTGLGAVPAVVASLTLLSRQYKEDRDVHTARLKLQLDDREQFYQERIEAKEQFYQEKLDDREHQLSRSKLQLDELHQQEQIYQQQIDDLTRLRDRELDVQNQLSIEDKHQDLSDLADLLNTCKQQIELKNIELSNLSQRSGDAESESQRIKQELQDYIKDFEPEKNILKSEIKYLESEIVRLTIALDDATGSSLQLVKDIDDLVARNNELKSLSQHSIEVPDSFAIPFPIDLSRYQIAVIGGHNRTIREVKALLLQQKLDPQKFIDILPGSEANNNKKTVRSKIQYCDLVVVLPSYVDHALTKIVSRLDKEKAVRGNILYIPSGGAHTITTKIINRLQELSDLN
jgi:hypothetical protein